MRDWASCLSGLLLDLGTWDISANAHGVNKRRDQDGGLSSRFGGAAGETLRLSEGEREAAKSFLTTQAPSMGTRQGAMLR